MPTTLRRSARLAERAQRERTLYPRGTFKHFTKSIYGLRTLDEDSHLVLGDLIHLLRQDDRHTTHPDLMEAVHRLYAALACAEAYSEMPALSAYKYNRLRRLITTHTEEAYRLISLRIRE
jgi:hypothetical protein